MSKFLMHEPVVIEARENYQKGSYRNRMHIIGANGPEMLSIPLRSGKHQQKPIREVEIAYDEPWDVTHWRAIKTAYGSAPYYEHYADQLESLIMSKPGYLFDFNLQVLDWLLSAIGLKSYELTDRFEKVPVDKLDLRNTIRPKSPPDDNNFRAVEYFQVFDDRHAFEPNLSILDLLFALGPATKTHLRQCLVLGC
jgi:hypothetical protein